jgi:hypothetical protein
MNYVRRSCRLAGTDNSRPLPSGRPTAVQYTRPVITIFAIGGRIDSLHCGLLGSFWFRTPIYTDPPPEVFPGRGAP